MAYVWRFAARSDVGLIRMENEDSAYAGPMILAVADGMGGHAAGELASAIAVATLAEMDGVAAVDSASSLLELLADSVTDITTRIGEVITEEPALTGMGTTLTALALRSGRLSLVHVGDSRAYLLRDGELHQITRDHTYVQTLIDSGRITEEEALSHPKRSLLVRAIDGLRFPEPDLSMREARAGDRYLLCSDGVSGVLSLEILWQCVSLTDPTAAVTALVEAALAAGAPDNATAIVADVVQVDDAPAARALIEDSTPVVVGAAGETRNRERLPGLTFPVDFQQDSEHEPQRPESISTDNGEKQPADLDAKQTQAAADTEKPSGNATDEASGKPTDAANPSEPAVEPAETTLPVPVATPAQTRRRHRWVGAALGAGVAVLLLIAAVLVTRTWMLSQYYVGPADDRVAIYQGVNSTLLGTPMSSVVQLSETTLAELPQFSRNQVEDTIDASDLENARAILNRLEERAQACRLAPQTPGCPQADELEVSP